MTKMLARILWRIVGWTQIQNLYGLECEERAMSSWTIMRTWERDTFRSVAIAVSDSFSSNATRQLSALESALLSVLLSVVQHHLLLLLMDPMCLRTLITTTWEVSTTSTLLSARFLTYDF